jgi:hypothetical protein
MSVSHRIFLGVSAFLLVVNILVMNDLTTIWDGAEALMAWQSGRGEAGARLPGWLLAQVWPAGLFAFRLPGALLLLAVFPLYWYLSKPILGATSTRLTLLVLAASFLVPNLAKVATGDIWAMASQWLAFAALLRFLKQPLWQWQTIFYLLLALAVWVQPAQSLVFLIGSSLYLYFVHPQGRNLRRLQPWLAGPFFAAILFWIGALSWDNSSFLIGFRSGRFLSWNFLGMLPFLGFSLTGIWEIVQRARRKEEFALIHSGALIFALLGHSLALTGLLALLAAKQIQAYFKPGYPYKAAVQAVAILHLLAVFFGALALLAGGLYYFEGTGYRAAAASVGLYWMLSFIAVLGLIGMNRRHLLGGAVLGGLLCTTQFWLQLNPLLDSRRSWPAEFLAEVAAAMPALESSSEAICLIYSPAEAPFPALAVQAQTVFREVRWLETANTLQRALQEHPEACFLVAGEAAEMLPTDYQLFARAQGWGRREGHLVFGAWKQRSERASEDEIEQQEQDRRSDD